MNIDMKKTISFLLLMAFALLLAAPSYAATNDQNQVFEQKINEYQYLKMLKSKTDAELTSMDFSNEEIEEIRNLDYAAELKKRSYYDDKTLKNMGYTDEQINILSTFTGTEQELITLSATLTLTGSRVNFWYSSGNQYYKIRFDWIWSTDPIFNLEDIIGVGWGSLYHLTTSTSYSYHKVYYKCYADGTTYDTGIKAFTPVDVLNATHTFPMIQYKYDGPQLKEYWAYKGTGYIQIYRGGSDQNADIIVKYGHTYITIIPSITIYPEPGVGFTFSTGVSTEDTLYLPWPAN